jgi:propanol-preferring alcohol dehydrogenase
VDGAFADYVVRPVETLIVPPKRIDPATLAVLTDAVGTPYHALARVARVQPGETVAVLGIGGIGSNAVQVARGLGARVIAVSRSADKLALARRLGADAAVTLDEARAAIGPDGPDVVVQCAASAAMDEAAIALGGYGGRIVLVGTTVDAFSARASDLVWRELSVMGSRGFTPDDIRAVIDLYLDGLLQTDHLTSVLRPLEEANAALEDLRAGRVLRSVLVP